jgi:catechol 2,3-dioxygenase-like lactoylglutathione lyase family enzyme
MSLFKAFNHVSITVTDLAKAKDFYGGLLGFPEIPRPAFNFPGVWYGIGDGLSLHIIVNETLVPIAGGARIVRGALPALRAVDG